MEIKKLSVVAETKDDILLCDDILRYDFEGLIDILNSEKVFMFKGHRIPLQSVWLPKRILGLFTGDTTCHSRNVRQDMDRQEEESLETCLLVETDLGFKHRYGGFASTINCGCSGHDHCSF